MRTRRALSTERAGWFAEARVMAGLDVREMLAAGEQPVNQVVADLQALGAGDIYRLVAPFMPAPLVDKATSLGYSHWVTQPGEQEYVIYVWRGRQLQALLIPQSQQGPRCPAVERRS